ncbi:MAG TPA: adenylate/guanylate cyclase domain-containing protein [Candidatus Limnocylindria bacterium]
MVAPEVRYARSGELSIAYQVVGEGASDLVYATEFWQSIETQWLEPRFEAFLRRLASFSRLILFDYRGTGLSDPTASLLPPLEEWMEDLRVVLDAVGSRKAALIGSGGGGSITMMFAAAHPERTKALVLLNAAARLTRAPDYPFGNERSVERAWRDSSREQWGRAALAELVAPGVAAEPAFREWWARNERLGLRQGMNVELDQTAEDVDIRGLLPSIQAPTLVISRKDNRLISAEHGRYLAEMIPEARYVEVSGADHLPFIGDSDAILDEVEEFLTGFRHSPRPDRVLATVLFTDIVGSTERAVEIGDRAWRDLLDRHNEAVRGVISRFHGREIDTAGDGFLVLFDGPGRAIRAAQAIAGATRQVGLEVRSGVHSGEVELVGSDIRGIAVHVGARVMALAAGGEILVSSTVRDLVAGSDIDFDDRGVHRLKGVPGEWRLFRVRP